MLEFMDESELIAEFHRAGIYLPGEVIKASPAAYLAQESLRQRLMQRPLDQMSARHAMSHQQQAMKQAETNQRRRLGALGGVGGALGFFGNL